MVFLDRVSKPCLFLKQIDTNMKRQTMNTAPIWLSRAQQASVYGGAAATSGEEDIQEPIGRGGDDDAQDPIG